MKHVFRTIIAFLKTQRFFYAVVALLILQAGWIALSGRYPMAYDEQNHLGVVKLYVEHPSPFWAEQPPGPAPYSSVSRDPSYLYHWLMSFPYRVLDIFWKTDDAKVLAFRFISIGLFTWGLFLYRRLLLTTQASPALVHAVLMLFVLMPTVPFLAGQMNYDNLLFPMVAGALLLTIAITASIRRRQPDGLRLAWLAALAMAAGLVKFPFLAIMLPMLIWIGVVFVRSLGRKNWRQWRHWRLAAGLLVRSFQSASKTARVTAAVLVVASGVLFIERYGVNAVRYGTPVPECDQVLNVERCMAFGPWRRNYNIYQSKLAGTLDPVKSDVYNFTYNEWLKLLVWQFFYTLNGPIDNFSVGAPLPVPYYGGVILASVGACLIVIFRRYVFRRPYMRGLVFVAVFYVFVLWAQNYSDFLRLGLATAIQARYIILVLPIFLLALALAYNQALRHVPAAKVVLAIAAVSALLTQGGGIGVFIMRSNESWWWQSGRVIQANQAAQRLLMPIVIGEDQTPAPRRSDLN